MIRSQSYCFRATIIIHLFFSLHLLLNTFASHTQSLCRQDQRDILLELKKELKIPNDEYHVISWNTTLDCCSWWGVTCDAKSGRVISLDLIIESANVSLTSGSSLFQLRHLRQLVFTHGNLQGVIPSSIANLTHLTCLDLSNNLLVGEVPASIGKLNQLIEIHLSGNYLRGNIPTSFANLTKLSQLVLSENQFTGGITVVANLTSVFNINLSQNNFKSLFPPDLSGLHKLGQFVGSRNSFFGPFPSSLFMISSLFNIELNQNKFKGPIDFGNMSTSSTVRVLTLGYNDLDGPIPESISKLGNLEVLDLSHNNFGGRVPRSTSKLAHLVTLDLSYNKLEGQVPHWLWRSSVFSVLLLSHNSFSSFGKSVEVDDATWLNELGLGSNSLQGPFPQWICKFKILRTLDLSNNHFTGFIPQCLNSLQDLNLRNNGLSGSLPDFNNSDLRSLDVSRNSLVGGLPKSLTNCTSMQLLNVKGNKINDTFPFWLDSLSTLMVLALGSNAFHGPIYQPSTYLGFPSLKIIDISNNSFVGSLPQDYFSNWSAMPFVFSDEEYLSYMEDSTMYKDSINLVSKGVATDFVRIPVFFKAIDFSGNGFSGQIPESIGVLSGLRLLNLSGNAFTGSIPPSLANITILETLDLSRNNLSGEIPRGLGNLSFLSNINFSHNHLQGFLPRSTQFERQNCSSFSGNPKLHGLEDICGEIHVPVPKSQQHEEYLLESEEPLIHWVAVAIAYVPGVFCGLVIGHIFTSYKYEWFIAR
ncbi:unnamed protein product [Microthlaspi erraticum]|uniref:Uncharacterized protein n=1 Tax=Microthlaspi erraticum TaxID=1685480 RepID=A0A6D2HCI2_9BRAS|nr:unnamed protein product [Microthlaspi erraticum]